MWTEGEMMPGVSFALKKFSDLGLETKGCACVDPSFGQHGVNKIHRLFLLVVLTLFQTNHTC
jgi:hypothetical protein